MSVNSWGSHRARLDLFSFCSLLTLFFTHPAVTPASSLPPIPSVKVLHIPTKMTCPVPLRQRHHSIHRRSAVRDLLRLPVNQAFKFHEGVLQFLSVCNTMELMP